ncbi:MAG: RNA polymerase factor sigma-54 [Planctomycetes bacterium]|nr:RNA polymerase factor sigma-54 [Planctomycetota bacterium]
MRFDTSMQVRLEQRMKLAPRMIQSMEILQLPLLSLEERIQQELVSNPVLEMRDQDDEPREDAPEPEPAPAEGPAEEERPLEVNSDASGEEFDRLQSMADEWDGYFDQEYIAKTRVSRGDRDAKLDALQNTAARGENLHEMLLDQFSFFSTDPVIRELGETIIRNLDDNGYLRVPLDDLLMDVRGSATMDQAETALGLVQRLDPPGVGARDLRECLLIQLKRHGDDNVLARKIVADYLHDIESNRYPQVAKRLGVSIGAVKDAVADIQHLNPKPGASITQEMVPYITPDVEIVYDEKLDEYRVVVIDERTPRLYISQLYRKMLRRRDLDTKTREFVTRNVRSARWLIEAIEQRKSTLLRVVQSIVKFQRPFLDQGPEHLQPLKMQQVADAVGLHVGTISRAVDDKYADTPWGVVALRRFFTGGTETADGETIAWDHVRTKLKEMVDAEDKKHPLSDDQIMERFKEQGIDLARRTVAKYRKIMNIPSSRRRKEF